MRAARPVSARGLPVGATGRFPRTVGFERTGSELLVDFEKRTASILRMHLHVTELVSRELTDDANTEFFDPFAPRRVIVTLCVITIYPPAPPRRSRYRPPVVPSRNGATISIELIAEWQQRVHETEVRDAGVAITNVQAEKVCSSSTAGSSSGATNAIWRKRNHI